MTGPRVETNRYLDRLNTGNRYLSRLEEPEAAPRPSLASQVVDFAKETAVSIPRSFRHAMLSPVIGSETGEATAGVLGNYGGGVVDPRRRVSEDDPGAITGRQAVEGGVQTLANVAAPGISRIGTTAAARAGAGLLASRVAGSAASGAVGGAAYAPDDPLMGAAIGGVLGAVTPAGKPKPGTKVTHVPERPAVDMEFSPIVPDPPALTGHVAGTPPPRRIAAPKSNRYIALLQEKHGTDFTVDSQGRATHWTGPKEYAGQDAQKRLMRPRGPGPRALLPEKSGARDVQRFGEARTDGGSRRPITGVTTDALFREFEDVLSKIDDAAGRAIYDVVPNADKGTEIGAVMVADRRGGGPSRQAKALQNLADYERIMKEIQGELSQRGVDENDLWEQVGKLADQRAFEAKRPKRGADFDPDEGFNVYDIGGAVAKGLRTRAGQSAALGAGGMALQESDDEKLQATGRGIVALSLIRAGYPQLKKQAGKAAKAAQSGLMKSETGRKVLGTLSQDFVTDPRIVQAGRQYEQTRAMGRVKGAEAERLASSLGPSADRRVSDIIEGESFERVSGPDGKKVLEAAQRISDEFTALGQRKSETGLLRSETVAKREGRYLPRMYAAHTGDGPLPAEVPVGGKKIRVNAERARDDALSADARNALGEIRESSVRASVGLERGYNNVAAAKLLNDIVEIPGAVDDGFWGAIQEARTAKGLYTAARDSGDKEAAASAYQAFLAANQRAKGSAVPDGYTRLPDVPGLGELKGAVVRKDVADYLNMVPDLRNPPNLFGKAWAFWKRAHTVWNPGTHVGNVMSNVAIAHMGGLPINQQIKALPKALKAFKSYDADTRFLAERGVLERGLPTFGDRPPGAAGERLRLKRLSQTTRPETKRVLEARGVTAPNSAMEGARKVGGKFERAYAMEDGVYRVALFKKLTAEGMGREKAADFVQKQFVDYGTRSPALTALKNTASPFIMYPAKAVPRILDQIVEHPVRWMTLAALWGGMDQYSRRKYGAIDENDLRPSQRSGPFGYLLPGTTQLPGKAGPQGERPMMDVARWTPLSALTGSPVPGSVGTSLGEKWPGILTPTGPIVDVGARMANRDPFTGDEWIQPGDSPLDKGKKVAGAAASMALPSAASFHLPRVAGDLANKDYRAARTDALGFVGLRPTTVRPGMQQMGASIDLQRAISAERKALGRALRKAANNPERQEELRSRAQERVARLVEQFQKRSGG